MAVVKRQGQCCTPTKVFVLYIQFIFQQCLIKVIKRSHTHFTDQCIRKTIYSLGMRLERTALLKCDTNKKWFGH